MMQFKKCAIMTSLVECLYCGVQFRRYERHPVAIEYINGYPDLCRMAGDYPYMIDTNRDFPAYKSVHEYRYMWVED